MCLTACSIRIHFKIAHAYSNEKFESTLPSSVLGILINPQSRKPDCHLATMFFEIIIPWQGRVQ